MGMTEQSSNKASWSILAFYAQTMRLSGGRYILGKLKKLYSPLFPLPKNQNCHQFIFNGNMLGYI